MPVSYFLFGSRNVVIYGLIPPTGSFMRKFLSVVRLRCLVLLVVAFVYGCVNQIDPKELRVPTKISCVYLEDAISYTDEYGIFNFPRMTRLEKGLYWTEKVDSYGTYYRGPPGGVSVKINNGTSAPATTRDGGFYVPNDLAAPIVLYSYFSMENAPAQPELTATDCVSAGYIKDPRAEKVSLVTFAVVGATIGTTGMLVGRSVAGPTSLSYGQAAGAGAVGGLIGGLIVASITNSGVGKIVLSPLPAPDVLTKLRALVAKQSMMREVQAEGTKADIELVGPTAIISADSGVTSVHE